VRSFVVISSLFILAAPVNSFAQGIYDDCEGVKLMVDEMISAREAGVTRTKMMGIANNSGLGDFATDLVRAIYSDSPSELAEFSDGILASCENGREAIRKRKEAAR